MFTLPFKNSMFDFKGCRGRIRLREPRLTLVALCTSSGGCPEADSDKEKKREADGDKREVILLSEPRSMLVSFVTFQDQDYCIFASYSETIYSVVGTETH